MAIVSMDEFSTSTELYNQTTPIYSYDFESFDISLLDYPLATNTWRAAPTWEIALKISFYIPIILVSFIGNGLITIVLLRKKSLQSITNTFILNLTMSDVLVTCTSTWVHMVDDLSSQWVLGPVFCKLNVFMQGKSSVVLSV